MAFYTWASTLGNSIVHIGYDDDGRKFVNKEKFQPRLAIESNKQSDWKTLHGQNVEFIDFDDIRSMRNYYKNYKDALDIYGMGRAEHQFINERYENLEYDFNKIRVFFYDIEVNSDSGFPKPEDAAYPVVSIAIKDSKTGNFFVLGYGDYDLNQIDADIPKEKVFYKKCKDETSLLLCFIRLIEKLKPDVLTGWYSSGFDDPYMCHRIIKVLGEEELKRLSPVKKVDFSMKTLDNGDYVFNINIVGLSLIDYKDLYQKYMPGDRESFALGFISSLELGTTKINYEEVDGLFDLYHKNYQKFITYNMVDTELLFLLENKLGLIELHATIAYMAKCNFKEAFSPVKTWDCYIYQILRGKKIVIPPEKHTSVNTSLPGGHVMDPKPGLYDWVVSFDLNSLYPMLIQQYNISPETIIDGMVEDVGQFDEEGREVIDDRILNQTLKPKPGYVFSGSGQYYRKDKKGFIPEIMFDIYANRSSVKKSMIADKQEYERTHDETLKKEIARKHNIQLALKILMNSLYGSSGNKHFRYFDLRMARSITLSGQLSIRYASNHLAEYLEKTFKIQDVTVYRDTDSVVGESMISVNDDKITIEDFYEKSSGKVDVISENNFVKHLNNDLYTYSINRRTGKLEKKKIKYVMKHKVKKKLYKITVGGKSVTVTEDHSLIVKRDGILIDCKPKEVKKGDKIIKLV